jgi:hypothetical protein
LVAWREYRPYGKLNILLTKDNKDTEFNMYICNFIFQPTICCMKNDNGVKPVEIYCGNPWQVGIVKSLLEDSGIKVYMQDAIMGTLNPWWTAPGGAGAIRLFISDIDYERAKEIVDKYERNLKEDTI